LSESSSAKRFLQRVLPDSWRFAHHMAIDLRRQIEYLPWRGRVEAFDTYFLRQAEAMLRPRGLTELVGGEPSAPGEAAASPTGAGRWSPRSCSISTSGPRSWAPSRG
jgi:hypothetical protein